MGRTDEDAPTLPPKIKAAFDFLYHTYRITDQSDASITPRELSPLEKSVEKAALRTVQQYLLGEMDFVEDASPTPRKKSGHDDDSTEPVAANI